ncbi:MAG TPA: hypothetical protein VGR81_06375 [Candidatus Acidoferrales bacterium]|nr:hypothetical protein [Candidatus Acidoferrales bacterium]
MKAKIILTSIAVLAIVLMLAAYVLLFGAGPGAGAIVLAQSPGQIELACPSGSTVMPGFQSLNPATGKFRQQACFNPATGVITLQPDAVANAIPSLPISLTAGVSGILPTANGGTGNATGNAATATALASAGTNCGAGSAASGVDASGNALNCLTPANVGVFVSAATNFGASVSTSNLVASLPSDGIVFFDARPVQVTAGVGCSSSSNTVTPQWSIGAVTGGFNSGSFSQVSITGNGSVGTGASPATADQIEQVAKAGTAVGIGAISTLASTGCSTVPQYRIYAKVIY